MEQRYRLVLLAVALLLCLQSLRQGHGRSRKGIPVAFLHYSTPAVIVRLEGAVPQQGIYTFPDGSTIASVINLTHGAKKAHLRDRQIPSRHITSGDIIELTPSGLQGLEITLSKMKAQERMLLGMPLNPDTMNTADWEALPGIGPALARTIITDRQNNGGFGSIEGLARVPGVGEKKISTLRIFFKPHTTH